jgi:isopentenyl-diphosphate Delta-isomerase
VSEELFQTYDEDGRPLALVPRSQVHRTGLWHRAANVLLFRSNGELLLQKRAAEKDVCPGLWDLSVAEHLVPGETFLAAAQRGLAEELGIESVELSAFGEMFKVCIQLPGIHDCEFQQTFHGLSDAVISPDPLEVAEVKTIALSELARQLDTDPEAFTPWFRQLLVRSTLLD